MSADVNVTEKVAEAILGAVFGQELPEAPIDLAVAALSALADPEVLAGIAGVLAEHRHDVISYDAWSLDGCDCGWTPTDPYSDVWDQHRAHQAAAVVAWITGRRG